MSTDVDKVKLRSHLRKLEFEYYIEILRTSVELICIKNNSSNILW